MPKTSLYKEKLGLDPTQSAENGIRDGHNTGADFKTYGGYEESLSKFKGIVYTLNIYQLIGTVGAASRA